MSIWSWIKGWRLDKAFASLKNNGVHVAIVITQAVKDALNSGIVGFVADLVSKVLPELHDLPQTIIAELNKAIPKVLSVELAIQGLPDNPTEQDILSFENSVLDAFSVHDKKSKLYTTLAAQIYEIIKKDVDAGTKLTFAELVKDVDEAYQDYLKDKEEADNTNP